MPLIAFHLFLSLLKLLLRFRVKLATTNTNTTAFQHLFFEPLIFFLEFSDYLVLRGLVDSWLVLNFLCSICIFKSV
jgi:hypothetical protein